MRTKLSIGVIGGGEGASKAIRAIRGEEDFEVTKVLCAKNELTGLVNDKRRVNCFEDFMKCEPLQAVYIATPNSTHLPLAKEIVAKKNVPVLIEKPLCVNVEDARDFLRGATAHLIHVAFKKRFNPGLNWALSELDRTQPISVNYRWSCPAPTSNWYYELKRSGGGVLTDLGSHVLDLLELIGGGQTVVKATSNRDGSTGRMESATVIETHGENGFHGLVELTWSETQQFHTIEISHANGSISLNRNDQGSDIVEVISNNNYNCMTNSSSREYIEMFRALKQQVELGSSELPTIFSGIRNMELISSAYDLISNGAAKKS